MNSLSKASEQIAGVFDGWLKAEVIISGESRNKYLDANDTKKFLDLRKRIRLPYDSVSNWSAQKDRSHQTRWPSWLEAWETTRPTEDEFDFVAGRMIFAPLMSVSGAHRIRSYLQAEDSRDYLDRRAPGISIGLEEVISEQLAESVPNGNFDAATLSFDGLKKHLNYAYTLGEIHIRGIPARRYQYEMGHEGSLSAKAMQIAQKSWIAVATDCVVMAAKLRRGDLEAVPFLEPVSITDQSGTVHYPLREPIKWAEVLAV